MKLMFDPVGAELVMAPVFSSEMGGLWVYPPCLPSFVRIAVSSQAGILGHPPWLGIQLTILRKKKQANFPNASLITTHFAFEIGFSAAVVVILDLVVLWHVLSMHSSQKLPDSQPGRSRR